MDALSREPFSKPQTNRTKSEEVSATNRIRSAAEICNWQPRFSDPRRMPNQSARYFAPACNAFTCGQTKAVLAPRKPKKLRCQKKHRNFEAGFGVNTGASRRIARHTRTHWRAHESSDPSRASHRRIVVRKRPLNVRNSHVPFGKRSRISPERRRESSLVSGKKTREVHGRGEAVIPARSR